MIGDNIRIRPEYENLAQEIYSALVKEGLTKKEKVVIAIGGESGSGKSVTSVTLSQKLTQNKINNKILHQDDYFHLPPKSNRQNRLKSLDNVGVHEVDFQKFKQNIQTFKQGGKQLEKPLVKYQDNIIVSETLELDKVEVLILEGTYVLSLDNIDYKIFIDRSYKDTLSQRLERNRDIIDDFSNLVLEIEHKIIRAYKSIVDAVISKEYEFNALKNTL